MKYIYKIYDYLAYLAGANLLFLASLTFCDVFGRRFFNSPVSGTIEIVELGMAVTAFLAMPRAFLYNTHVSAEFIENIISGKIELFLTFIKGVIMLIILSSMTYATFLNAYKLSQNGRVTLELELPFYPFYYFYSLALLVSTVAVFLWCTNSILINYKSENSDNGY